LNTKFTGQSVGYHGSCSAYALSLLYEIGLILSIEGGSTDPEKNTMLAASLKTAKVSGVPKENIERALAKVRRQRCIHSSSLLRHTQASGGKDKGSQLITYEALAYGTIGVIM
jgi:transcriptional/translational regulatory protein YebC/TACO1